MEESLRVHSRYRYGDEWLGHLGNFSRNPFEEPQPILEVLFLVYKTDLLCGIIFSGGVT